MSTYLVTGAAGFIAARTTEMLLAAGHTVVGLDNLNDYYDVRLKDYRVGRLLGDESWRSGGPKKSVYARGGRRAGAGGRFIFEPGDIEDRTALERLFAEFQFEGVFNLAARAGVGHSMRDPHAHVATNVQGTLNVLECGRKHGVKKLVLASTSSLYAGSPMPFDEEQAVNTPLSPYAASKKAGELMAYSYHKLYGLDISVLRYFTVFGPVGRPDMCIFRFIQWIQSGRPLQLFGDGSQGRDFTYVDDIARGTILAAQPVGYEIINLAGGRSPLSLSAVIVQLEKSLGKKAVIAQEPFQAVDIRETSADIAKAGRLLGWAPEVSPLEGLRRTVAWHQAEQSWLKDVVL